MSRKLIDSGVDWIGKIPEHWNVQQVRHAFIFKKSKAKQENPIILSLARDSIKIRDISNNEGQIAESYYDYNPVDIDDFLINPMDLYSGANCNVSKIQGVISPAYYNVKHKERINPYYYDYYFKVQYWQNAMFAHGKGVSFDNRWTLTKNDFLRYLIPKLSFCEQNKIVSTLNKKIEQIDKLISIQEKQIELLKEYKKSIISKVVTKGLDPNVPMKDSGIEWIGEIPAGWNVANLGSLFFEHNFKNKGMKNTNLLSLSYGNVINKDINDRNGLKPESFETYNIIDNGDIVLRLTDLQNDHKSLRTGYNKYNGIITSAYVVLRKRIDVNSRYFQLVLHSFDIKKGFYGMGDGVRQSLKYKELKYVLLPFPKKEVQEELVEYVLNEYSRIDKRISLYKNKIEKLQEYKKSLIYEYVTGKISVE